MTNSNQITINNPNEILNQAPPHIRSVQANFWLYQYQMLMASKPAKILREEEEAMHAASKALQLEKPLGDDEYQGPAVSIILAVCV